MRFKVGEKIKVVYYADGHFVEASVSKSNLKPNGTRAYSKGDLVLVRFVKSVKSFGITVQLDAKTFGSIALCEITDEKEPNMLGIKQEKSLFLARIIDSDKKGRL